MDIDDLDKSLSDMQTMRIEETVLGHVDRYEIVRKLGEGGFGAVYGAKDVESGIFVALKSLPPEVATDQEEMEDIRANFQLISKLHHPVIASVLYLHRVENVDSSTSKGLGIKKDDYLVVMEYAAGSTLFSYIRSKIGNKFNLDEALKICKPLAEALDYAHSLKILHRDIKPKNIMVSDDGQNSIKILDFGLAAEIKSSMSRKSSDAVSSTSGTPLYMAPEQWAGRRQDGAADQYALAAILYELLVGEVPFKSACDSGNLELIRNVVLNNEIETIDTITKHQNLVLKKGLAKDPKERFKSCTDFINAFNKKKLLNLGKAHYIGAVIFVILTLIVLFTVNFIRKSGGISEIPAVKHSVKQLESSPLGAVGICFFDINPVGADIKIYGMRGLIHEGISPLKVQLNYGDYDIVINKRGYLSAEQAIRVNSDKTIELVLQPLRGELKINTIPEANVMAIDEDGMEINLGKTSVDGSLEFNRLLEGNYEIVIRAANYFEKSEKVFISSKRAVNIDVPLIGLPGDFVILSADDFEIYLDGKLVGVSNEKIFEASSGLQTLILSKEDHEPINFEIDIIPNSLSTIEVELEFNKLRRGIKINTPIENFGSIPTSSKENLISLLDDANPSFKINDKEWMDLSDSIRHSRKSTLLLDYGSYEFVFRCEHSFIPALNKPIKFNVDGRNPEIDLLSIDLPFALKQRQILVSTEPKEANLTLSYIDIDGIEKSEQIGLSDKGKLNIPRNAIHLNSISVSKPGFYDEIINLKLDYTKPIAEAVESFDLKLNPSTSISINKPVFKGILSSSSLRDYMEKMRFRYRVGDSNWAFIGLFPHVNYLPIGRYQIEIEGIAADGTTYTDSKLINVKLAKSEISFTFETKPSYVTLSLNKDDIKDVELIQGRKKKRISIGEKVEIIPFAPFEFVINDKTYRYLPIKPGSNKVVSIEIVEDKAVRPRVH